LTIGYFGGCALRPFHHSCSHRGTHGDGTNAGGGLTKPINVVAQRHSKTTGISRSSKRATPSAIFLAPTVTITTYHSFIYPFASQVSPYLTSPAYLEIRFSGTADRYLQHLIPPPWWQSRLRQGDPSETRVLAAFGPCRGARRPGRSPPPHAQRPCP
jgi:hypothetical protein